MKTHLQVIAWLYILFGVFGILAAFVVALLLAGIGWIANDQTAITVMSIIAACASGLIFLTSAPGVVVGAGLLGLRRWSRVPAILLGLLNLSGFPVGTALGLYTLYVMLDDETSELLTR